jgi:hypothetical protein
MRSTTALQRKFPVQTGQLFNRQEGRCGTEVRGAQSPEQLCTLSGDTYAHSAANAWLSGEHVEFPRVLVAILVFQHRKNGTTQLTSTCARPNVGRRFCEVTTRRRRGDHQAPSKRLGAGLSTGVPAARPKPTVTESGRQGQVD